MTTKKKSGKSVGKLGTAIPVRLPEDDKQRLKDYEKAGLNSAELIRRCVNTALDDVVREMLEELSQIGVRR